VLYAAAPATAAPGDLDPSFGRFGRVTVDRPFAVVDATRLPDGRIAAAVNAGYPLLRANVLMLGAQGEVDTSFGQGGIASPDPSGGYGDTAQAQAVAAQPDGRIVVAGRYLVKQFPSEYRTFVTRLEPDGRVDESFGDRGFAITGSSPVDFFGRLELAVGPDGHIYVAESDRLSSFTATGEPETGFGSGGSVSTPLVSRYNVPLALAVLADGRIAVGGGNSSNPKDSTATVLRYLPDGSPDPAFGEHGAAQPVLGPGARSPRSRPSPTGRWSPRPPRT
jgi:uncharacterized delta-60 repeat protein